MPLPSNRPVISQMHGEHMNSSAFMIVQDDMKLIFHSNAENQLFNLTSDPEELNAIKNQQLEAKLISCESIVYVGSGQFQSLIFQHWSLNLERIQWSLLKRLKSTITTHSRSGKLHREILMKRQSPHSGGKLTSREIHRKI